MTEKVKSKVLEILSRGMIYNSAPKNLGEEDKPDFQISFVGCVPAISVMCCPEGHKDKESKIVPCGDYVIPLYEDGDINREEDEILCRLDVALADMDIYYKQWQLKHEWQLQLKHGWQLKHE